MDRVRRILKIDDIHKNDILGRDVVTAIFDTGASEHADLSGKVLDFIDFVNHKKNMYDDSGHGTHIAGIIAGSGAVSDGKYMGIAPESRLLVLKCLDYKGNGSIKDAVDAIDFVIQNKKKYNIRIANISIGSELKQNSRGNQILLEKVEELWRNGITVVAAAGNNGPEKGSITVPGCSKSIITVGTYDYGGKYGKVYEFSGRGPTQNCIVKPEILCLGDNIVSLSNRGNKKKKKSGTSMSAPICAGIIALLLEKYPFLTNKQVKYAIYKSCDDVHLDRNIQGWGVINAEKLVLGSSTKKGKL